MKRTLPWLSIAFLLFASSAHAQLYKWVGPDGKVTYSDTPPPKTATKVERKSLGGGGTDTSDFPFELAEAVKANPVTLYTTAKCAPCDDGRKLLQGRGIPFSEKTVNSNDDIARLKQAGGESNLPFLTVGRNKQSGFQSSSWSAALTAAGYPETSLLPKTYRSAPAEAAAPAPKAAETTGNANTVEAARAPSDAAPEATGNAPPGFKF